MEHDSADILGHSDSLVPPVVNRGIPVSPVQTVVLLLVSLSMYFFGKQLWDGVLKWRESTYKLAMRRRHGIPDTDLRPFNVAYADAMARAREEDQSNSSKPYPSRIPPHAVDQFNAPAELDLRQRSVTHNSNLRPSTAPVPGAYSSALDSRSSNQTHRLANNDVQQRITSQQTQLIPEAGTSRSHLADQTVYYDVEGVVPETRKRAFDDSGEFESKKFRTEEDELIDGDEDAEFQEPGAAPKRGSKRGVREEEDSEDGGNETSRGKRARKISVQKQKVLNDDMEIDDEEMDDVPELLSHSRGKKRDRTEAASTFGGDDDDSDAEQQPEDDHLRRRRRKRRTVAKRKSEATYLRGKKREREDNEIASEDESDEMSPVLRKKRGKRGSHVHQNGNGDADSARSDVSMDESTTSTRSKARQIGDEWESNGIRWKIGPNGQRLRQALVKKARQKFVMPKDSKHPDRNVNLQVCLEVWLTEEEYQDAKKKRMLAWQDSPNKDDTNLSIDTDSVPFPGIPGKNLLWSASTSSTPAGSPASVSTYELPPSRPRNFPRHSIATSVGLNPFVEAQSPTVKRISRAVSLKSDPVSLPPSTPTKEDKEKEKDVEKESEIDSPRNSKVFSKWEKQEFEARAMMKLREVNRKKEEDLQAKLRAEKDKADRLRKEREEAERRAKEEAARRAASSPVPKITVTAPSSESILQPTAPPAAGNGFFGLKPESAKATPAAPPASKSGQMPDFFAKPAQSTTTATAPASEPPKFSFGTPSNPTTSTSSSSNAPPASTTSSTGLFGAISTSVSSNPLFGRVGPTANEAGKQENDKASPAPTPNFPFPLAGTQSKSAFGGGPSTTSAPATNGTTSATNGATSGATTTPKFNFGFNKPATSTTPTHAATSAFSSAPASSTPNPAATDASKSGAFAFKVPGAPASAFNPSPVSTSANTNNSSNFGSNSSAPKFSFGLSGSGTTGNDNKSSAFGGSPFGTNTATTTPAKSAFGNTTTTPTASAFGGGVFSGNAATSSAFGTAPSSTTPASNPPAPSNETSKSSFSFGVTPSSTTANNAAPAPSGSNSAPAMNSTNTTTPAAGSTPKFSFGFNPSSAGTAGSGASKGSSAFGSSGTSAFGTAPSAFGNPVSNTTASAFGTTTTPGSTPASITTNNPSGPNFSFNFPSTPSTTPASGNATTTTPATPAGGSSNFGFGQPVGGSTTPLVKPGMGGGTGVAPNLFGNTSTGGTGVAHNLFGNTSSGSSIFGATNSSGGGLFGSSTPTATAQK